MRVEILQESISQAVNIVSRFVPSRPSLPILTHIKIEAKEEGLVLIATNMDTAIEYSLPAKITKPGNVLVPARILNEYLNQLPSGKMELSLNESGLVLKQADNQAQIQGSPPEDFPDTPVLADSAKEVTLKVENLDQIVRYVNFSASNDEARPVLAAVLFETINDSFQAVATDGYRLSLKTIKTKTQVKFDQSVLIPAKILSEVNRLAKDNQVDTIKLHYDADTYIAVFKLGETTVTSRLIEGNYPPYERIIPKQSQYLVKTDTRELLDAVKAAQIFAKESGYIVKLEFVSKGINVSARASQVGQQQTSVASDLEIDEPLTIAFNAKYLVDCFSKVDTSQVTLGFTEPLKPVIIEPENKSFSHIIMPVRVQDS